MSSSRVPITISICTIYFQPIPSKRQIEKDVFFTKRKLEEEDDSKEDKIKKDECEKEDASRKRRKRIQEFLAQTESDQGPDAKRRRVGTVYDTIKKYALSEDKLVTNTPHFCPFLQESLTIFLGTV